MALRTPPGACWTGLRTVSLPPGSGSSRAMVPMLGRLRRLILSIALLALPLWPVAATGGARLDCKGVVTFADAMTRAVRLSVDPDRGTVHMPSCRKYAELHGLCHGDLLGWHEHQFRFGGL